MFTRTNTLDFINGYFEIIFSSTQRLNLKYLISFFTKQKVHVHKFKKMYITALIPITKRKYAPLSFLTTMYIRNFVFVIYGRDFTMQLLPVVNAHRALIAIDVSDENNNCLIKSSHVSCVTYDFTHYFIYSCMSFILVALLATRTQLSV